MNVIEQLNVDNLVVGKEYKYVELCNVLQQPVYKSSQKDFQLREFERFFCYERDEGKNGKPGRWFRILEIYDDPVPYKAWVAHNAKYVGLIQDVLMGYLGLKERIDMGNKSGGNKGEVNGSIGDHVIHVSSGNLWELLGMVNKKYGEMRSKRGDIIKLGKGAGVNVSKGDIDEFYLRSGSRCNSIVISALNSLKRRGIIKYCKVYRICIKRVEVVDMNGMIKKEWFEYKDADDEEMEYIVDREYKVMRELGVKDKNELMWNTGLRDKFYERIDGIFREEKGWWRVFKTFKIWYSTQAVVDWFNDYIGIKVESGVNGIKNADEIVNSGGNRLNPGCKEEVKSNCIINKKKQELNRLVYETLCEQVDGKVKNGMLNLGDDHGRDAGWFDYYIGPGVRDRQVWLNDLLVFIGDDN